MALIFYTILIKHYHTQQFFTNYNKNVEYIFLESRDNADENRIIEKAVM